MFAAGKRSTVPLYRRRELPPGQAVDGPAIIAEDLATTVVEPGWRASITDRLDLLLTRVGPDPATATRATTEADPVLLEVFGNLFMAVAEQMGERLRSTAHSVNIKERLDFSCAIFDADGGLIANAPHIPVHLGSMGESIKMVIDRNKGRIKPGDVYALNDPYHGGTHLPDVTVVTPVFPAPAAATPIDPRGPQGPIERARGPQGYNAGHDPSPAAPDPAPWFYVASRGHHAEIGGISPGSMPAASTRIEEEGVLIDNWLLVENGRLREEETRHLLTSAEYPSRNPDTNLADLRAQVAANEKGVEELRRMVGQYGLDVIRAYMQPHPGERGRVGPQRHRPAGRRRVRLRARQPGDDPGEGHRRQERQDGRPSTSPAPARSSATTSTPRPAWRWRPCCTCSARWSTRTYR